MADNDSLLDLINLQLTPRREWFAAVEFRDGTLARANDVMSLQARVQDGIRLFAFEIDSTMQRLVEALIDQLISIKIAQDAFQAYMTAQIDAFAAALAEEIRTTLAALETKIADIKVYVDDKIVELYDRLKAYCDARYEAFMLEARAYTDARLKQVDTVIKDAQRRAVTFEQQAEDSFDYTNNPDFDSNIFTVAPHYRFYVHGYSYVVSFQGAASPTESGRTCTVTVPQLGIAQVDTGAGAAEFTPTPRLILYENEALRGNISINGGTWKWQIKVEGFYAPRALWPLFDAPL